MHPFAFKDVVKALCKKILVPVAEKCLYLDRQFLTEDRLIRLLEEDAFTLVRPEDFDDDYDLIYVGSAVEPMANKELLRDRMIHAYTMLASDPLYSSSPEAKISLMGELLKTLGIEDREKLLPELPTEGMKPLNGQARQESGVAVGSAGAANMSMIPGNDATQAAGAQQELSPDLAMLLSQAGGRA